MKYWYQITPTEKSKPEAYLVRVLNDGNYLPDYLDQYRGKILFALGGLSEESLSIATSIGFVTPVSHGNKQIGACFADPVSISITGDLLRKITQSDLAMKPVEQIPSLDATHYAEMAFNASIIKRIESFSENLSTTRLLTKGLIVGHLIESDNMTYIIDNDLIKDALKTLTDEKVNQWIGYVVRTPAPLAKIKHDLASFVVNEFIDNDNYFYKSGMRNIDLANDAGIGFLAAFLSNNTDETIAQLRTSLIDIESSLSSSDTNQSRSVEVSPVPEILSDVSVDDLVNELESVEADEESESFVKSKTRAPAQKKIEDVGEIIPGAKKFNYRGFGKRSFDPSVELSTYMGVKKAQIFPALDYASLYENKVAPEIVAFAKMVRDALPEIETMVTGVASKRARYRNSISLTDGYSVFVRSNYAYKNEKAESLSIEPKAVISNKAENSEVFAQKLVSAYAKIFDFISDLVQRNDVNYLDVLVKDWIAKKDFLVFGGGSSGLARDMIRSLNSDDKGENVPQFLNKLFNHYKERLLDQQGRNLRVSPETISSIDDFIRLTEVSIKEGREDFSYTADQLFGDNSIGSLFFSTFYDANQDIDKAVQKANTLIEYGKLRLQKDGVFDYDKTWNACRYEAMQAAPTADEIKERISKQSIVKSKKTKGSDVEHEDNASESTPSPAVKEKKIEAPLLYSVDITPIKTKHLKGITYTGPDYRNGRDIEAEDFRTTFGFKGVQFGEWLPDNERQSVLNMAYDSFCLLAETFGVERSQIAINGTLSLAFGARGISKAAAHYEPGLRVINLTRMSGAGSLMHEYFHALDHALYDASISNSVTTKPYQSHIGDHFYKKDDAHRVSTFTARTYTTLYADMKSMLYTNEIPVFRKGEYEYSGLFRLMSEKTYAQLSNAVTDFSDKNKQHHNHPSWNEMKDQIRVIVQATVDSIEREMMKRKVDKSHETPQWKYRDIHSFMSEKMAELNKSMQDKSVEFVDKYALGSLSVPSFSFYTGLSSRKINGRFNDTLKGVDSEFAGMSKDMDGGKSKYYFTPHEMGARLCETLVYEHLKSKGIEATYLVSRPPEGHGYPFGNERQAIRQNAKVDATLLPSQTSVFEMFNEAIKLVSPIEIETKLDEGDYAKFMRN